MRPSRTAIAAGTAPASRTIASTASAVSRFCGHGMPWLTMVVSRATTGRPSVERVRDFPAERDWRHVSRAPDARADALRERRRRQLGGHGTVASTVSAAAARPVSTASWSGRPEARPWMVPAAKASPAPLTLRTLARSGARERTSPSLPMASGSAALVTITFGGQPPADLAGEGARRRRLSGGVVAEETPSPRAGW